MGVFQIKIPRSLEKPDARQTRDASSPGDLTPYEGRNPTFWHFSVSERGIIEMCLPKMRKPTN